jgi:hypothetical protein
MASSGASAAPSHAAKEEQARVCVCCAALRRARWRSRNTCADERVAAARQTLRVAAAELRSLKPGRAVYAQRSGGVFFLVPREAALQDTCVRLAAVARKHE